MILLGAVAAGCGGGGTDADGARPPNQPNEKPDVESIAERYGYDIETAQLTPTYAIVPEFNDPRDGYARDLLAAQCLKGIVEYRPLKVDASDEVFDFRTHQVRFDEQVASKWGYSALRLRQQPGGSAIPPGVTVTPAISEAMVACGKKTDERLGLPPQRLLNDIEGAGWEALAGSPELRAAAGQWAKCMAPVGVIDLPPGPDEMPSPSVATPGGMVEAPGGDSTPTNVKPSAREIEVAVQDVRCRDESGWARTALKVRATKELELIESNLEEFEAVRAEYQEYDAKLDRVIAELG